MSVDNHPDNDLSRDIAQDLIRLGEAMAPGDGFVSTVMDQVAHASRMRRMTYRWWIATGAVAASVALIAGWVAFAPSRIRSPGTPGPEISQMLRSSTAWQATSEMPITLPGDVPAREIDQLLFERVKWTDPRQHATFERMVPRQQVKFVALESY